MRLITLAAWAALCVSPAFAHGDHGGLAERHQNKPTAGAVPTKGRLWLPGDHHIHSEFSADYEPNPASPQTAPIPLLGKDGRYSISKNAQMARRPSSTRLLQLTGRKPVRLSTQPEGAQRTSLPTGALTASSGAQAWPQ